MVGFDATLGHHVSEEFAFGNPERTLLGVQLDVKPLEVSECGTQGSDQVVRMRRLGDDVINVDCDRCPRRICSVGVGWRIDLVGEADLHAMLVRHAHVLKPERHRDIAIRAEWGDEGCRELVGFLHRYLVVA